VFAQARGRMYLLLFFNFQVCNSLRDESAAHKYPESWTDQAELLSFELLISPMVSQKSYTTLSREGKERKN
jgi:hypothetical protein